MIDTGSSFVLPEVEKHGQSELCALVKVLDKELFDLRLEALTMILNHFKNKPTHRYRFICLDECIKYREAAYSMPLVRFTYTDSDYNIAVYTENITEAFVDDDGIIKVRVSRARYDSIPLGDVNNPEAVLDFISMVKNRSSIIGSNTEGCVICETR